MMSAQPHNLSCSPVVHLTDEELQAIHDAEDRVRDAEQILEAVKYIIESNHDFPSDNHNATGMSTWYTPRTQVEFDGEFMLFHRWSQSWIANTLTNGQ